MNNKANRVVLMEIFIRIRRFFALLMLAVLLAACAGIGLGRQQAGPTAATTANSTGDRPVAPTTAFAPAEPGTGDPLATPTASSGTGDQVGDQPIAPTAAMPARDPLQWKNWPVIPELTAGARDIFTRGQALGNDSTRFSKIGDCETSAAWFLADFDGGPERYSLGEYAALSSVIEHFKGSFGRTSLAARPGATAASLLTPLWADPKQCNASETPLDCELRLNKPAFTFILVGSNDVPHRERFEENLRKVIERTIDLGVVPVLATKADNLEGDDSLNASMARLAVEYDLPLWNFWAAVQPLPDHGLQPDTVHLTWASNRFDQVDNMRRAWPVRNLTALQTLAALWRGSEE